MSQQLSSKKRFYITADQKREIYLLKKNKPEPKNIDLAKQFNISAGQVSNILREPEKWINIDPNSYQAKLKRSHTSPFADVEEALALWIEKALECNLTITDSIIQKKATDFAELLNKEFKGSSGWLYNFKQRYSIREYVKHGESQSAPIEQLPEMRSTLQNLLKEYQLEDIFNCDETGLFWKMEPSRGLSTGPISGTKQSKDRVTVLLTCNATGTDKLIPLFIDNAPTHNLMENLQLTNIKIHHLPPNVTAHLQPCDAGIIHSFKVC